MFAPNQAIEMNFLTEWIECSQLGLFGYLYNNKF